MVSDGRHVDVSWARVSDAWHAAQRRGRARFSCHCFMSMAMTATTSTIPQGMMTVRVDDPRACRRAPAGRDDGGGDGGGDGRYTSRDVRINRKNCGPHPERKMGGGGGGVKEGERERDRKRERLHAFRLQPLTRPNRAPSRPRSVPCGHDGRASPSAAFVRLVPFSS